VLPTLRGAFCFVLMDERSVYAARDPHGVRPLSIGRLPNGFVVASETCALDIVGATLVRDVEPGELIVIDENGLRSYRFAEPEPKGCLFEFVYLARPDTTISGRGVQAVRVEIGRRLAREHAAEADLVIPVPESGRYAAIGFAQESGIPFAEGLVKNAYVGRTFIQPSQTIRQLGIRLKLNPLRDVIAGKRLVVVDDSIVRGNTQRALVRMLREAGALEVHVRISSPPVKWPCFYGIDFASRAELIANGLGVEEICTSIGADSLGFVDLEQLVEATAVPKERLCRACFDGVYPIALPEPELLGKHLLEGIERHAELVLKSMINAAKADGQIDKEEIRRIVGKLQEVGVDAETQQYVMAEMKKPMETQQLVAAAHGRPELAAEMYGASLLAIEVDTPAEKKYLEQLAAGLRLSPEVAQRIQEMVGLQPV